MAKNDISKTQIRFDAYDKCAGKAKYLADLELGEVLYAQTLRSEFPRAKILSIDYPEIPDGYYIVDGSDAPIKNRVQMLIDDQPFFASGHVNYVGEPILLIVGPDRKLVSKIIDMIVVNYSEIPAIYDIDDARMPGKPAIFGEDNIIASYRFGRGEVKDAFDNAAKTFSNEYITGYQEQLYLEPQAIMAYIDTENNDKIVIKGSMQCPYYVKNAMKLALDLDDDGVRIIQSTTGGAFGGKEDYPSLIAGQVAFATLKTKKPVVLLFDRTEDIVATTKRHPSRSFYRIALDKNGKMTAMDIDILLDAGAYTGLTSVVLQRALFAAVSVYDVPNLNVQGTAYATNNVPSGAFRGFGAPQSLFAVEAIVDDIAKQLGERPDQFRKKHFLKKGDDSSTGGKLRSEIKLDEILERVDKMSGFSQKYPIWLDKPMESDGFYHGIGLSTFIHGCGFTGRGEEIIKGTARLRKNSDDTITILISNVEMGQGAQTTLRKIVARAADVPIENVLYPNPDTDDVPDSGPTVASRTVMIVGSLLETLGRRLREEWQNGEEKIVEETYKHPGYIKWDQKKLAGDAYPEYSWGAVVVEVSVDPITFDIKLEHVWSVFDLGTPIDELVVKGQIQGGILQALGYATTEVMETNFGRLKQKTISDYIIPTTMDTPEIEHELVLNPYEKGPFGAKCAGELTLVGVAPAVANAVSIAIGKHVTKIPITPEYLMQLMKVKGDEF
ncbi:MAG: xanthine dehydrogenase family protein molybdopterin-binding subunit [Candidatus Zixiibacteriota bacterium]